MKINLVNVNPNKLHDELISNNINPLLVESAGTATYITFADGTDMELVQQIVDVHDPSPLPQPLSEIDKLKISQAEQFEALLELIGGM